MNIEDVLKDLEVEAKKQEEQGNYVWASLMQMKINKIRKEHGYVS